jgi:outer membrane protein, heavy metal efflux system
MFLTKFSAFAAAIIMAVILSGCSSHVTTKPASLEHVQTQLSASHPELTLPTTDKTQYLTEANPLLAEPLTPQTATQLMLLNSPRIAATLTQLDVADAGEWQASLLSNPRLSIAALKAEGGGWQWDLGLSQSLFEFITRSSREKQAANTRLATQLQVTQYLQSAIADLEQSYFAAIAATQNLAQQETLFDAANTKALLAQRLWQAGNLSELNYLGYLSEAQAQKRHFNQQQLNLASSQSQLRLALGLTRAQPLILPAALPNPLRDSFDIQALIADATQNRVDIQIAKQHLQQLASEQTLIQKEYGLADSRIGIAAKKETDGVKSVGPSVELALPMFGGVFDRGQAKLAQKHAEISGANAALDIATLQAEHDIQLAISAMAQAQTEYKDLWEAIKITAKRVEFAGQEVNYMLASPFDLIDIKTQLAQLAQTQTQAKLHYWQARSQLELALGHKLVDKEAPAETPAKITPAPANTHEQHQEHHHHD